MPSKVQYHSIGTPSKRKISELQVSDDEFSQESEVDVEATPSKKRFRHIDDGPSFTPRKISSAHSAVNGTPQGPKIIVTDRTTTPRGPKFNGADVQDDEEETPDTETIGSRMRNANRSAKRKSAGRLLERALLAGDSDDEASEEEDELAQEIYGDDEDEGVDDTEAQVEALDLPELEAEDPAADPETPSKRKRGRKKAADTVTPRKRGRKAAESGLDREETPPTYLPPHERYFWDNRVGANKTSNSTFPSTLLLNHDEYVEWSKLHVDPHQKQIEYLLELHEESYEQWGVELEYGFNICLYGFGSKRGVMEGFAEWICSKGSDGEPRQVAKTTPKKSKNPARDSVDAVPNIVIVDGFEPSTTIRHVLTTIATMIFPPTLRLPAQPTALVQLIVDTLSKSPLPNGPIYLLINSMDALALRRTATQHLLASLAASPHIKMVATCDTPNFGLLWDLTLKKKFNWVFHECTTFMPFTQEIDVVESVNTLLGRSSRRVAGRDGVSYVLRSLPENARNLYRVLVGEQLAIALETDGAANGEEEGIEYRILYLKAREELICSTEHQFRTLLKEFFDHQMVESRRDGVGSERLVVPFRVEELEGLLEDLVE